MGLSLTGQSQFAPWVLFGGEGAGLSRWAARLRAWAPRPSVGRTAAKDHALIPFDQTTLLIAVVFVIAGTVKGTIGIGLPTVSVGIMSQFFPPHFAIAVVIVPMVITNIWQVYRAGEWQVTARRYWLLIVMLAVSIWVTTFFTAKASPELLVAVIGVAIVIFAATSLARPMPPLPDRLDRRAQVVTGVTAGILGGLTSIWSPPMVTYLLARRVERDDFVRAAGLFIFLGSLPLALGFWQTGLLDGPVAQISAWMILPTLAGFTIGEALRRRMEPERFRRVVLWIFLFMGLNLLRRAFF